MPDIDLTKRFTKEECDSANHQYKLHIMNDVSGRIVELEKCQMLNDEQHKTILDKLDRGFGDTKETLLEVIRHQKHTNGDVSALKIWRAGIAGGLAAIVAFGGFVSTYFFIEMKDQKDKNEQVIILKEQMSRISEQLKDLEVIQ